MLGQSIRYLLVVVVLWLTPLSAFAQYKNSAFGLSLGTWSISQPSLLDSDGDVHPIDSRPLRINQGLRFSFDSSFKMNDDHWWLNTGATVGLLRFNPQGGAALEEAFDEEANNILGTLMGIEASLGLRYYFLTDRMRPYLQASLSFLRMLTFTDRAEVACELGSLCETDRTNLDNFLPHPNVGAVHLQPGFEWIFTRDIGLNVFIDFQRWLIFNADDNNALVFGIGINLYT